MFRIAMLVVLAVLVAPSAASAQQRLTRAEIREAQRALDVTADGHIGPRTRRAIRRFQRAEDLNPVDGRLHDNVLVALGVGEETDPAEEPATDDTATASGDAAAAVEAARSAIGSPYASGGTDTSGFDCSGLTVWAFDQAGVDLPRTSYDQFEMGEEVADDAIQAGDLVFFDTAGDGASHVGIATGPDTAISATSSRGVVEHSFADGYWADHFIGARRLS